MNEIFIPGNVPSLKNSKQWIPPRTTKNGKYIRGMLIPSKTVQKYLKTFEQLWIYKRVSFKKLIKNLDPPYHIGFHFVRNSKRRYDHHNAIQLCADLMVKYNWIEDDDTENFYGHPLKINNTYSSYDKKNPGVYIKIIENV